MIQTSSVEGCRLGDRKLFGLRAHLNGSSSTCLRLSIEIEMLLHTLIVAEANNMLVQVIALKRNPPCPIIDYSWGFPPCSHSKVKPGAFVSNPPLPSSG